METYTIEVNETVVQVINDAGASVAEKYASNAQSSADLAAQKASAASASASSAASMASLADVAYSGAQSAAQSAETHASAASASAVSAAASAVESENHAASSANSAANANTFATSAYDHRQAASTSANTATTKANEASESASTASNAASTATTKAAEAAASALSINPTATPTPSRVPVADGGGRLNGWISAATESAAGIVELATTAEVQAGTDTIRAVTPAALAAVAQAEGWGQFDDFFESNGDGDLMPSTNPISSRNFTLNAGGDIQPDAA